jgi:dihydroorotase
MEKIPGCSGVKIFMGSSTGDLLVPDDESLEKILASGYRRVAVHCEDELRLRERKHIAEDSGDVASHPLWRDELTAIKATERILIVARKTGRPVHILHVTTGQEMELLKNAKDIATVECTPQHLTLFAPDCYRDLGSKAQMNPPIRNREQLEAIWKALNEGIVDVIGSDHAPHTLEEKAKPYPQSPSGMTGVQTLLPIMLDHVAKGRLSLVRLCDLIAKNPARIYGDTRRGVIAPGKHGSLTIVDLKRQEIIEDSWIASKSQWSPYHGKKVQGWPVMTIVSGHVVMRDGALLGSPSGTPVLFHQ